MSMTTLLTLPEIEQRVCDVTSEQLGIPRADVRLSSRLIEDLGCDSLDLVELLMELEDEFDITIPNEPPNLVYKSVFTRTPFCVSDLAELAYLQQGTGRPQRKGWRKTVVETPASPGVPFSQLGGRWGRQPEGNGDSLFEVLSADDPTLFRRCSDGMRCVLLPSAEAEIGSSGPESLRDEQPVHVVGLDSFLIDAEPVSTTAFCRFLNSVDASETDLSDWLLLDPEDDRMQQVQVEKTEGQWHPVVGTERVPMVLVSWFGANAYSLWANSGDWRGYRDEGHLPSEAQWEYAARGPCSQTPVRESAASAIQRMRCAQHERGNTYRPEQLPMSAVNEALGMSPFGLHHMAGNVWQWCRDWYDESFYLCPESRLKNPVNRTRTGVRSERGGSWVGPAELCRSSYRRGRAPTAFGRCLGFRCISPANRLPTN